MTPSPSNNADQFFQVQIERFYKNVLRAYELVDHSKRLATNDTHEGDDVASDILRAGVVLAHATLEDLLRSIARERLPYRDEEALNKIPLVGTGARGRRESSFQLGKLAAHREKSVLDVIRESVDEHLLRSTYNDTNQIATLLNSLGVSPTNVEPLFSQLDALLQRRHQIVHRADRNQQEEFDPITPEQVHQWLQALEEFAASVISDVAFPGPGLQSAPRGQ